MLRDSHTVDLVDAAHRCIEALENNLTRHPSVVSVLLLGSLASGRTFDAADLDVAILIDDSEPDTLALPFSFYVWLGDHRLEVNLTQLRLRATSEACWDIPQLEAFSNSRILFDPTGAASELIHRKVDQFNWRDALVASLNQVYWKGLVHSERTVNRGSRRSARLLLFEGLDLVAKSIFVVNRQFPPHSKWLLDSLLQLPTVPNELETKLNLVLKSGIEPHEIKATRTILAGLYGWTLAKAREQDPDFPDDLYEDWANRLSKRQPVEQTFAHRATREACRGGSDPVAAEIRSWLAFHAISNRADLRARGPEMLTDHGNFVRLSADAIERIRKLIEGAS